MTDPVVMYPPIYLPLVSVLLWFGNDAIESIYEYLVSQELAVCCCLCKLTVPHLERLAKRLVFRMKRKYYSSTAVRVPVPGEQLFEYKKGYDGNDDYEEEEEEEEEEDEDEEEEEMDTVQVFAPSYLRQFRDMTKQRIVLIGGYGGGESVSIFDVVDYKARYESLPVSASSNQEEAATRYIWEPCPSLQHGLNSQQLNFLRGELVTIGGQQCVGVGAESDDFVNMESIEHFDILSKQSSSTAHPVLPLKELHDFSSAVINDKVYITGGCYDVFEFDEVLNEMVEDNIKTDRVFRLDKDPVDPSISTLTLMSAKLNMPRSDHSSIVFEGRHWVAGAFRSSSVEVYDAASGDWKQGPSMVKERYDMHFLEMRGELYAVGGDQRYSCYDKNFTIEKLDKQLGAWRVITEHTANVDRFGCGVAALGSKIYVFGSHHEYCNTWDAFDIDTEQWASAAATACPSTQQSKSPVRRMPRGFSFGQAVTVPPMKMTWPLI